MFGECCLSQLLGDGRAALWEALMEELIIHWELWRTAGSICTSCSVCFVGMTEVSESFVLPLLSLHLLGRMVLALCVDWRRLALIPGVCTGLLTFSSCSMEGISLKDGLCLKLDLVGAGWCRDG